MSDSSGRVNTLVAERFPVSFSTSCLAICAVAKGHCSQRHAQREFRPDSILRMPLKGAIWLRFAFCLQSGSGWPNWIRPYEQTTGKTI